MIIVTDTNIVGAICNPSAKSPDVRAIQVWAKQMEAANHRFIVPAVVDYEQRREHLRRNAMASLAELDLFVYGVEGRYLPIFDGALKRAANLWANVWQHGLPTADVKSLDCDIILAAQVLELGLADVSFVVVTTNTAHLGRVINCQSWQNILP